MSETPRLGQRVRSIVRHNHLPIGTTGMVDQISGDDVFILLDRGGWFGWVSFASWAPTGESDVALSADYIAMRTGARP